LPTHRRYIAFWSYARFDNTHDGLWLSDLKNALQAEIQALSGVSVEIFQDVEGIVWGERWQNKIQTSEDDAAFLIPIVTPSYFKSGACRSELEQFVERENSTGFRELILPLYYIECPQLEDKFIQGTDRLARIVAEHNYEDIRSYRHRNLGSYEALQKVKILATGLIDRLNGFARSHLSSNKLEARITAPALRARVPRKAIILGTRREVSEWIEIWLAVEIGARYHPQTHLSSGQGAWQASVILGRLQADLDANRDFTIHVVAVTEAVSDAFERYLTDAAKQKEWSGVPKPQDSRILTTLHVLRDDSASMFGFMEGVYDEHGPNGTPTGGMIRVKLNGTDSFATEAQSRSGATEWTGSIKMAVASNQLRGEGIYNYSGKADFGEHRLTVDASTGDLRIEGKNVSLPGRIAFQTVWKRRGKVNL
jgi:hypothetical protein